uniref:VENN motif pre-toxin domain-containing protein n=1 Tax=Yersinia similis TaxID=367190 RepID=UPI001C937AFB
LSTLAAGLAGGLTGDSTADALAGGQAGKNAVENNFLSVTQLDNFAHKAKTCEGTACQQVIQDMVDTNLKQQNEMLALCSSQPAECADDYGYLVEQWNVFDKAIKQLDADDKLPNKFKNYLSAVYSSGIEAQGTVASVGWQKKFEALGLDKDTAAAMAATVPGLINGKGRKNPVNVAKNPVRFIEGVTVKDIKTGQTFSGTVDLKPTLDRIASGGTYPHRNDGTVFKNLPDRDTSKIGLPSQPIGYYKEYVHPTPNISGPGPQRVIVGKNGEAYYTNDHYKTFIKIK